MNLFYILGNSPLESILPFKKGKCQLYLRYNPSLSIMKSKYLDDCINK